jgi:hypothetical protein
MGGSANARGGRDNLGGAGDAGSPGTIHSNAACDCTAADFDSFDCTLRLGSMAVEERASGICSQQDSVTTRVPCDDGGYLYSWVEGGENEYELEVDPFGEPLYYSASGYVDDCGVDPAYQYGSVTAGVQQAECYTDDACAPCDDGSHLPRCLDCTPMPESNMVSVPLDEYCAANVCPPNVAGARQYLAGSCDIEPLSEILDGCGTTAVLRETGDSSIEFFYDDATGTLTGVLEGRNAPYGQCHAEAYLAGALPGDCQTVSSCEFCTAGSGAAGAAGEGGRAGGDDLCAP